MRSRIQHSWLHLFVAACAACSVGVVACSDNDPETGIDPLQGASGNAGSPSSNAGAGGRAGASGASSGGQGGSSGAAAGGSAGGAAAGTNAGGSANAAAGAAGAAGSGPDVGGEPDAGGGEEPDDEEGLSFATDVLPIFAANCGTCHTTQRFAGHSVGGALPGSYNDALELGMELLIRIDGGGMPQACGAGDPGDPGCLTVQQVETVRTWIADGSQP